MCHPFENFIAATLAVVEIRFIMHKI
jgi:hypothetical protein